MSAAARASRVAHVALALALSCGGAPRPPVAAAEDHGAQQPRRAVPPRPADDERRPESATAPRDLPVVELRTPASPLVTFRVVFEGGSADDPPGREGLTRLVARLMVEGGTEALTYEEFTRRLFPMAASVAYHVDRDMVAFVGQVHRDHLAAFYPLFRDVLLRPRLAEDDFRRVRAQSESDLTQDLRGGNDEDLGREFLQALIYQDHPYGHPPVGTERGLAAITLADARAQRERVLCRGRAIVGLAGGYPEDLAATVRADMAQLPAGCAARASLPDVARPRGVHVALIDKPAASATAISLGHPISVTRADRDHAALQFVTNYLGIHRQSSGVLYQTLREARGLNYGDYMYAEHFEQEGYSRFPRPNLQRRQQYASIWIRPVRPATAHFALRAAVRAVARTLEHGVPPQDFERTRTFLAGYVSLYAQTESQRLGYAIDELWIRAAPGGYPQRMRAAWSALDPSAAATAARAQLTAQDLWVAIVAPNARELAAAIGSNARSPITYESPKPPDVIAEDREIEAFPLQVRPDDVRVVPLADVFR